MYTVVNFNSVHTFKLHLVYTIWPEFTKEVCRQTKVYVRFDAFLQTLVCKKQKEVCLSTNLLCEFGPLCLEL